MNKRYSNQINFTFFSSKLSKLRQKLSQLIKSKSNHIKIIFGNRTLIKGGVYILNRKCGKPACRCATSSYRHPSYYLYKSVKGKNTITYLKSEEVSKLKILTKNYIKFRHARAQLIKNEQEIMNVINQIEKERTVPFIREGKIEKKKGKGKKKAEKKSGKTKRKTRKKDI